VHDFYYKLWYKNGEGEIPKGVYIPEKRFVIILI